MTRMIGRQGEVRWCVEERSVGEVEVAVAAAEGALG